MKIVIISLLFFVGVGISIKGIWDLALINRSLKWPTAYTVITSSTTRLKTTKYFDKELNRQVEKDKYWPDISYEYYVDANHYKSTRITTGVEYGHDKESDAKKVVKKYKVGKEYEIRYNHSNPSYAILETAPKEKELALIIFGVLFSGFATAFWFITRQ